MPKILVVHINDQMKFGFAASKPGYQIQFKKDDDNNANLDFTDDSIESVFIQIIFKKENEDVNTKSTLPIKDTEIVQLQKEKNKSMFKMPFFKRNKKG